MKKFISEFIQYAFIGKSKQQLPNDTISEELAFVVEEIKLSSSEEKAINTFILALNWVALFTFILLLMVVIFYIIFRPDQEIPCIIENMLATPAGYLGGVLATFWKKYTAT